MWPDCPKLARMVVGDIAFHYDPALYAEGVVVAFSERTGGVSAAPYDSLNLGDHVGDDRGAVEENIARFARAAGVSESGSHRVLVPEQTHGAHIAYVTATTRREDLRETDAVIVSEPDCAVMLCFADCVPVILAAPNRTVAVVHAGWRGAYASLPGTTARELSQATHTDPHELFAYIGPHICARCYEVSFDLAQKFAKEFGAGVVSQQEREHEAAGASSTETIYRLDLNEAVRISLLRAGLHESNIVSLGCCTAQHTDRFYSYRAEGGTTGRHGALASIRAASERLVHEAERDEQQ